MSEEEQNKGQEGNNKDFNEKDIEAINKDIEEAKSKLVSKETEEKVQQAKEEAKKEAEKEFLESQKAKELEEENQKFKEQMEQKEKEALEKMTDLTNKVNSFVESKAVINKDNPFAKSDNEVEKISDEDIDAIEQKSYEAFVEEKVRRA